MYGKVVCDELVYGGFVDGEVVNGETSDKIIRWNKFVNCCCGVTYIVFITINSLLSYEVHLCATYRFGAKNFAIRT